MGISLCCGGPVTTRCRRSSHIEIQVACLTVQTVLAGRPRWLMPCNAMGMCYTVVERIDGVRIASSLDLDDAIRPFRS